MSEDGTGEMMPTVSVSDITVNGSEKKVNGRGEQGVNQIYFFGSKNSDKLPGNFSRLVKLFESSLRIDHKKFKSAIGQSRKSVFPV